MFCQNSTVSPPVQTKNGLVIISYRHSTQISNRGRYNISIRYLWHSLGPKFLPSFSVWLLFPWSVPNEPRGYQARATALPVLSCPVAAHDTNNQRCSFLKVQIWPGQVWVSEVILRWRKCRFRFGILLLQLFPRLRAKVFLKKIQKKLLILIYSNFIVDFIDANASLKKRLYS